MGNKTSNFLFPPTESEILLDMIFVTYGCHEEFIEL